MPLNKIRIGVRSFTSRSWDTGITLPDVVGFTAVVENVNSVRFTWVTPDDLHRDATLEIHVGDTFMGSTLVASISDQSLVTHVIQRHTPGTYTFWAFYRVRNNMGAESSFGPVTVVLPIPVASAVTFTGTADNSDFQVDLAWSGLPMNLPDGTEVVIYGGAWGANAIEYGRALHTAGSLSVSSYTLTANENEYWLAVQSNGVQQPPNTADESTVKSVTVSGIELPDITGLTIRKIIGENDVEITWARVPGFPVPDTGVTVNVEIYRFPLRIAGADGVLPDEPDLDADTRIGVHDLRDNPSMFIHEDGHTNAGDFEYRLRYALGSVVSDAAGITYYAPPPPLGSSTSIGLSPDGQNVFIFFNRPVEIPNNADVIIDRNGMQSIATVVASQNTYRDMAADINEIHTYVLRVRVTRNGQELYSDPITRTFIPAPQNFMAAWNTNLGGIDLSWERPSTFPNGVTTRIYRRITGQDVSTNVVAYQSASTETTYNDDGAQGSGSDYSIFPTPGDSRSFLYTAEFIHNGEDGIEASATTNVQINEIPQPLSINIETTFVGTVLIEWTNHPYWDNHPESNTPIGRVYLNLVRGINEVDGSNLFHGRAPSGGFYFDDTVQPETEYNYFVSFDINNFDIDNPEHIPLTITTPAVPDVLPPPHSLQIFVSGRRISFSWFTAAILRLFPRIPNIESVVYKDGVDVMLSGELHTYNDPDDLEYGREYVYGVKTTYNTNQIESEIVTASVTIPIPVPALTISEVGYTRLSASWTVPDGMPADAEILISVDGMLTAGSTLHAVDATGPISFDLTPGTQYVITARYRLANGTLGELSMALVAMTRALLAPIPTGYSIAGSDVVLSWTNPNDNLPAGTSVVLYRDGVEIVTKGHVEGGATTIPDQGHFGSATLWQVYVYEYFYRIGDYDGPRATQEYAKTITPSFDTTDYSFDSPVGGVTINSWDAPADFPSDGHLVVYASTTTDFSDANEVVALPVGSPNYEITTLTPGTRYHLFVVYRVGNVESAPSPRRDGAVTIPTPENLMFVSQTATSITVSWERAANLPDNTNTLLFLRTSDEAAPGIGTDPDVTITDGSTSHEFEGLSLAIGAVYIINARFNIPTGDPDATLSEYTSDVSMTIPVPPPQNLVATVSGTFITATWERSPLLPDDAILHVNENGVDNSNSVPTTTEWSIFNAIRGQIYTFTARYEVNGVSSEIASVSVLIPHVAPTNLVAAVTDDDVTLTWDRDTSANSADVTIIKNGVVIVAAAEIPTNTYIDNDVTRGQTHTYAVRFDENGGEGPEATVTTTAIVLAAPMNFAAAIFGTNNVVLSWERPDGLPSNTATVITRGGTEIYNSVTPLETFTEVNLVTAAEYVYEIKFTMPGVDGATATQSITLPLPAPINLAVVFDPNYSPPSGAAPGRNVVVTWTIPAGLPSGTQYVLTRNIVGTSVLTLSSPNIAENEISYVSPTPGSVYEITLLYRYNGVNSASVTASAMVPHAAPLAPTNLMAVATDDDITVSWSIPAGSTSAATATITRGGVEIATDVTGTTYTDQNLARGQTYDYTVALTENSLTGPAASVTSDYVRLVAPTNFVAVADPVYDIQGDRITIQLSWDAFSGTLGPTDTLRTLITLDSIDDNADVVYDSTDASVVDYRHINRIGGTTYNYFIRFQINDGEFTYAATASETAIDFTPPMPTDLTARTQVVNNRIQVVLTCNIPTSYTLADAQFSRNGVFDGTAFDASPGFPVILIDNNGGNGLAPGVYSYTVRFTLSGILFGPETPPISVSIPWDAPESLTASTPGNSQVVLSWSRPASVPEAATVIIRKGTTELTSTLTASTTTYTDTVDYDANEGQDIEYSVIYRHNGVDSTPATVTAQIPQDDPVMITDLAASVSLGLDVMLTWTAPPGAGAQSTYTIRRDGSPLVSDMPIQGVGGAGSFTDMNVPVGTYTYEVFYTENGVQAPAATEIVTVASMTPSNFETTSVSHLSVAFSWQRPASTPSGVTTVIRRRRVGGSFATVYSSTDDATTFTDDGTVESAEFRPGTDYNYEIYFTQNSVQTATVTLAVSTLALPAPENLVITFSDAASPRATFTWSIPSDLPVSNSIQLGANIIQGTNTSPLTFAKGSTQTRTTYTHPQDVNRGTSYRFELAYQYAYSSGPFDFVSSPISRVTISVPHLAPLAPVNLAASVVGDVVTLSWALPAGTTSFATATVTRDGTELDTGLTDLTYPDHGVANGDYIYAVSLTEYGLTGPVATVSVTVNAVVAFPTPLTFTATSAGRVATLAWTLPDGLPSGTQAVVTRGTENIYSGNADALTATESGLDYGTEYTYTIILQTSTDTSASITATVTTEIPQPGPVIATLTGQQAALTWTNPDGLPTGFATIVLRPNGAAQHMSIFPLPSYNDQQILPRGADYTWQVRYRINGVDGPIRDSNTVSVPHIAPLAPVNLAAAINEDDITLSWALPAGTTSAATATITRDGTQIATGVTALTYNDQNLARGSAYTYTVTLTENALTGPAASVTSAVIPVVPAAPANLARSISGTEVTLTFERGAHTTTAATATVRRGNVVLQAGITGLSYTFTNIQGDAFEYFVFFTENGIDGDVASIEVTAIPPTPTGVEIVAGHNSALLWWTRSNLLPDDVETMISDSADFSTNLMTLTDDTTAVKLDLPDANPRTFHVKFRNNDEVDSSVVASQSITASTTYTSTSGAHSFSEMDFQELGGGVRIAYDISNPHNVGGVSLPTEWINGRTPSGNDFVGVQLRLSRSDRMFLPGNTNFDTLYVQSWTMHFIFQGEKYEFVVPALTNSGRSRPTNANSAWDVLFNGSAANGTLYDPLINALKDAFPPSSGSVVDAIDAVIVIN